MGRGRERDTDRVTWSDKEGEHDSERDRRKRSSPVNGLEIQQVVLNGIVGNVFGCLE